MDVLRFLDSGCNVDEVADDFKVDPALDPEADLDVDLGRFNVLVLTECFGEFLPIVEDERTSEG